MSATHLFRPAHRALVAALSVTLLATLRAATPTTVTPAPAEFINTATWDYRSVIPAPPASDSFLAAADAETVHLLDERRTADDITLAKRYDEYDVFKIIQPVLGTWATPENLPQLAALLKQVSAESKPFTDAAKKAWNRPRPYVAYPELHPVLERSKSSSYPSGHATGAAFHAALLTALLPEYGPAWARQTELIGWSRLVGGMHFPSDIVAGKTLGEAIAREMLKSPALQRRLDEVRAELAPFLHRKAA